jgi:hypothetical protein
MNDEFAAVLQKVDLLLAESSKMKSRGPVFRIVYRFREAEATCLPSEEIAAVSLVVRTHELPLPLSPTQFVLFDYLARHRHIAQTVDQILAGIRTDRFFTKLGANVGSRKSQAIRISRGSVKQQIRRIRLAIVKVSRQAKIPLDPDRILISEKTVENSVRYRLRAEIVWEHLDLEHWPVSAKRR